MDKRHIIYLIIIVAAFIAISITSQRTTNKDLPLLIIALVASIPAIIEIIRGYKVRKFRNKQISEDLNKIPYISNIEFAGKVITGTYRNTPFTIFQFQNPYYNIKIKQTTIKKDTDIQLKNTYKVQKKKHEVRLRVEATYEELLEELPQALEEIHQRTQTTRNIKNNKQQTKI